MPSVLYIFLSGWSPASGPCSGFAVYFCPLSGTGHGCLIGNAILYPGGICHSFVALDWKKTGELVIYDPWDGNIGTYTIDGGSDCRECKGRFLHRWIRWEVSQDCRRNHHPKRGADRDQKKEKTGWQLRTAVEGYGQFPRETDLPNTGIW